MKHAAYGCNTSVDVNGVPSPRPGLRRTPPLVRAAVARTSRRPSLRRSGLLRTALPLDSARFTELEARRPRRPDGGKDDELVADLINVDANCSLHFCSKALDLAEILCRKQAHHQFCNGIVHREHTPNRYGIVGYPTFLRASGDTCKLRHREKP